MSRYTSEEEVELALRAPKAGAASWTAGEFDDLIEYVCEEADSAIDRMCPSWQPFDGGIVSEDRTYLAGGSAVYGILSTDPFTVMPTVVVVDDTVLDNIEFTAYQPIKDSLSGKSLLVPDTGTTRCWIEGVKYKLQGGTWGWSEIPRGVLLSGTRIATKSFHAMRNKMGIVELPDGSGMYEPRYDSMVTRWLGEWMGSEVQ